MEPADERRDDPSMVTFPAICAVLQWSPPIQGGTTARRCRLDVAGCRRNGARVVLDDTDLAAPSILAGISRLSSELLAQREEQIARAWQRRLAGEITRSAHAGG